MRRGKLITLIFATFVLCFPIVSCSDDDDGGVDDACSLWRNALVLDQSGGTVRDFTFSKALTDEEMKNRIMENGISYSRRAATTLRVAPTDQEEAQEPELYPYYLTQYDEAYMNDLKAKCWQIASETSVTKVSSVEAVRFRVKEDDSSVCIVDFFDCLFWRKTEDPILGSATDSELTPVAINEQNFELTTEFSTRASKQVSFKVRELLTEECVSGANFENDETTSYILFPKEFEECKSHLIDDEVITEKDSRPISVVNPDHKYKVSIAKQIIKVNTLEELLNTEFTDDIQFYDIWRPSVTREPEEAPID